MREARTAAEALPLLGSAIRVAVAPADARTTADALRAYGARFVRQRFDEGVLFLVANRRDLSAEEHPFFAPLLQGLKKEGVRVRFASIP